MRGLGLRRAAALGILAAAFATAGCGDDDIDDLRDKVDKAIDENRSTDELRDLLDDAREQGDEARDEVERLRRELREKVR